MCIRDRGSGLGLGFGFRVRSPGPGSGLGLGFAFRVARRNPSKMRKLALRLVLGLRVSFVGGKGYLQRMAPRTTSWMRTQPGNFLFSSALRRDIFSAIRNLEEMGGGASASKDCFAHIIFAVRNSKFSGLYVCVCARVCLCVFVRVNYGFPKRCLMKFRRTEGA